jgi:hypothetical protein
MVDMSTKDSTDEEIIDILLPVQELRAENERLRAAVDRLCDESQHAIRQGDRLCACGRVALG